jgi:hypothetical protein
MEPEDMPITDGESARAFIDAVYERQWMKTSDGVDITPGLRVFTYDYKWGIIDSEDFERLSQRNSTTKWELTSNDFWFRVKYANGSNGLYNGERMITKCPNCRRGYDGCNDSGCGQRRKPGHLNEQKDPGEIGPGIHKDTPSN